MDGFLHALSAVSVLLMLMSVGYFMGVKGWMTTREKRFVSRYIVNIAVPCNCVVGLLYNLSHNDLAQAGLLVASGVLGVGVTLLISTAAAALLHLAAEAVGCLCGSWRGCPIPCLLASRSVLSCLVRYVCLM